MIQIALKTDYPERSTAAQAKFLQQRQPTLNEVGTQLLSLAKLDFEKKSRGGAGDDGTVWAPLAESTERKKARRGRKPGRRKKDKVTKAAVGKSQIGVDTGLMRNSYTPGFSGSDGKGGNVLRVVNDTVTVGIGRIYAEWFDGGNTRGMPARKLLPEALPPSWERSVNKILDEWISELEAGLAT